MLRVSKMIIAMSILLTPLAYADEIDDMLEKKLERHKQEGWTCHETTKHYVVNDKLQYIAWMDCYIAGDMFSRRGWSLDREVYEVEEHH